MSPMLLRFFTLVGIALAAATMQMKARAAPLAEMEVEQVRAVIAAQLQAFNDDDAEAAFATATPSVREAVGNSDRFLALVRGNYPMVYRPAGFGFLAPEKEAGQVLQMVLRESFTLVAVGLVLGLAVAYSVRRFVESTLFGLTAADPLTYAVVAGVLVAVTLLASLRPAQRAARVDPMIALRAE